MRYSIPRRCAMLALLLLTASSAAASSGPVIVGPNRDGLRMLQRRVDQLIGRDQLDVRTDYLGARVGDPDPGSWQNPGHAMELTLVDRRSPAFMVGWYSENGLHPVLDGVDDACVLDATRNRGERVAFLLPKSVQRFGFYVTPAGHVGGAESPAHLTNRRWNPPGERGTGGQKAALGGDDQMLVYDLSPWAGPQTWLVACETSDTGAGIGRGDEQDEHDFADVLFTVSGLNVTPSVKTTFGRIKRLYR